MDSLLTESNINALSVGIIKNDRQYVFHKGELLNGQTPNNATQYEIASLTKTFTGTLIATAIDEDSIQLEGDIRQYFRDSFPNLAYQGQGITIRDLLTHQSGLPNMLPNKPELFDNPDWDQLPFQLNEVQKGFSKADFFKALSEVELDTFPGTNFAYSNAGANLLGYLLEEVYQTSYADLLDE
ncbi:MAG: serine hydrolase domain-containing protein, partial [Bacteroidota bacterium]